MGRNFLLPVAGFLVCCALSAGLYLLLNFQKRNSEDTQTAPTIGREAYDQTKETAPQETSSQNKNIILNARADGISSSGEAIDIMEERFAKPEFYEPFKYKKSPLPVDFSSQCKQEDRFTDIHEFLESRFGIQASDQFPQQGQIDAMSVFWSQNGTYYQISAQAEMTEPPSYQLIYASSSRKSFDEDVALLNDQEILGDRLYTLSEATIAMKRILGRAKQNGATEGGRIIGFRQLDSNQKDMIDVTYFNEKPDFVNVKNLSCEGNKNGSRIKCHCNFN